MANHELYVVQGKTLDNIAGTMRAVLGVDKDTPIRFDEVANSDKTEQINADVETQTNLIAQIKKTLEGKASVSAAEIIALIDNSGVLDSTDGTATEKVEQLIDKADDGNLWYEASKKITSFAANHHCPCFVDWAYAKLPRTDFGNIISLSYAICGTQLEYIDFYINSAKCTNFGDALSSNTKLKWMVGIDLSSTTSIFDLFLGNRELETIQEPLNIPNVTNARNAFGECWKLKDIRFVAECIKISIAFNSSSLLTAESIQSIIDGLATVETAQTLTFHADAKILQSQVDAANAKGWTVAGGTVVSEEEYYE